MSQHAFVYAATRENFTRLVLENSRRSLVLVDEFETAMQQLIEILRREPGFRQGAARRGLQAVFHNLEKDDPRVKPYRAEFFRLAY